MLQGFLDELRKHGIMAMISERIADTVTAGRRWIFAGREASDGDIEADSMPVCQGVGQVAVPAEPGQVAAIVVYVGGDGDYPYAVALRDLRAQQAASDAGIESDAWLSFTSALFLLMKDGAIEARSRGGTAVALATKSDADSVNARVSALETAFNAHLHTGVTTGAGTSGPPATPSSTSATVNGTGVLKGE